MRMDETIRVLGADVQYIHTYISIWETERNNYPPSPLTTTTAHSPPKSQNCCRAASESPSHTSHQVTDIGNRRAGTTICRAGTTTCKARQRVRLRPGPTLRPLVSLPGTFPLRIASPPLS
jgi:hypothetical protein